MHLSCATRECNVDGNDMLILWKNVFRLLSNVSHGVFRLSRKDDARKGQISEICHDEGRTGCEIEHRRKGLTQLSTLNLRMALFLLFRFTCKIFHFGDIQKSVIWSL